MSILHHKLPQASIYRGREKWETWEGGVGISKRSLNRGVSRREWVGRRVGIGGDAYRTTISVYLLEMSPEWTDA